MNEPKFKVRFLEEAKAFLDSLGDKTSDVDTLVISTHGMIKKTDKIPTSEISRAERLREIYFKVKRRGHENV